MPMCILIADDHGLLRAGLRALLEQEADLQIVGEAGDGPETLCKIEALRPDLVLLDLNMPGIGGIQVLRSIKDRWPQVQVLVITMLEDEGLVAEALESGASGYIIKRAIESELLSALEAIRRGDLYVHPSLTRALLQNLQQTAPPLQEAGPESLSARELEILQLVAKGFTNRQIAEQLNLSKRTVETHRANVMTKLGLESRVDLVRFAMENNLIQ